MRSLMSNEQHHTNRPASLATTKFKAEKITETFKLWNFNFPITRNCIQNLKSTSTVQSLDGSFKVGSICRRFITHFSFYFKVWEIENSTEDVPSQILNNKYKFSSLQCKQISNSIILSRDSFRVTNSWSWREFPVWQAWPLDWLMVLAVAFMKAAVPTAEVPRLKRTENAILSATACSSTPHWLHSADCSTAELGPATHQLSIHPNFRTKLTLTVLKYKNVVLLNLQRLERVQLKPILWCNIKTSKQASASSTTSNV